MIAKIPLFLEPQAEGVVHRHLAAAAGAGDRR